MTPRQVYDCDILQHVAKVVSQVDSSPPTDSAPPNVKTPDLKTKTPDQPKQQKGVDVTSSTGESESVAKGVDINEMIERIDDIIAPLIVGCDPADQKVADETLQ